MQHLTYTARLAGLKGWVGHIAVVVALVLCKTFSGGEFGRFTQAYLPAEVCPCDTHAAHTCKCLRGLR